ncbi:MAG: right-handed parallel beta-helix repeat-containing protein [Pseudobdellovibrionaceae bacterium]|jgi:filamentous hemagglutinin family protein|nr:right-handed parallel beta-helix repeat-containing protein [Pseudobdellovibrionaceae bacterium]
MNLAARVNGRALKRFMASTAVLTITVAAQLSQAQAADLTLPTNPAGVGGTFSVSTPSAGQMHVDQTSDRVIINWDSFNIGTDARVQFFQPSSNSLAVNRVVAGVSPTQILGELRANGRLMVLDPNGVMFGAGSIVDVGGIVASSGNINEMEVMSGASILSLSSFGTGSVENYGAITAADNGLVAFVAPTVKNSGIIQANLGKVVLAAGNETATVDLYGDGLVSLAYTDKNDALLSENTGVIAAQSGKILMSAAQAKDVVDQVVNMGGVVNATSASMINGNIVLSAKTVNVKAGANVNAVSTQVTAKTANLAATIGGTVSGTADVVNVQSDAAKINQAIAIVSAGGTVYVAPGTYNESVTVNKAGVNLLGAKAGISGTDVSRNVDESIISPNSPGVLVTADGVVVDGFLITGADHGIDAQNADNVQLANNIINNSSLSGIHVIGSSGTQVTGNLIDTSVYDGIHVLNSDNILVSGNTVVDSGVAGIPNERGNGILFSNTDNSSISSNTISGSLWDAIKAVYSDDLSVVGNTAFDVVRSGVSVENSSSPLVAYNTLTNMGMVGVWSEKNSDAEIYGNYIDNAGSYYGIFHNYGNNATIAGNTVTSAGIYGTYIRNSDNVFFNANIIDNTGSDGVFVQDSSNINLWSNTISNSGVFGIPNEKGNGILLQNVDTSTVAYNHISGPLWDAIKAVYSDDLSIQYNTLNNATRSGVSVENSSSPLISNNTMTNMGMVGVWSEKNGDAEIVGNYINGAGSYYGIFHNYGNNATIAENTVTSAGIYGTYIRNSDTVYYVGNSIDNTGSDGIFVQDSNNIEVSDNTILNSGVFGIPNEKGNGILFSNTHNSTILGNTVSQSLWDNIKAIYSDNLSVRNNTLSNATRSGVSVENSSSPYIYNNTMTNMGMVGVWSEKNTNASIIDNTINDAGMFFGIFHNYGDNATITGNTITAADQYGLYVRNSSDLDIVGNSFANSGIDGVYLRDVGGAINFLNNTLSNFSGAGVRLQSVTYPLSVLLAGNNITNGLGIASYGVFLDGGPDSYVRLENNSIANNMEYGLYAVSGEIDLTGAANTISNTQIGMAFYPAGGPVVKTAAVTLLPPSESLKLTGDTIGETRFIDQTSLFVDLGPNAFFPGGAPTILDGMNATYTLGGVTIDPASVGYVTPAQYATLESMINHYVDAPDRGLFFFNIDTPPAPVAPLLITIDQSNVFNNELTTPPIGQGTAGGRLIITGLPFISPNAAPPAPNPGNAPVNFNDIAPAAGGDDQGGQAFNEVNPAAGGEGTQQQADASCWADANRVLGQGTAVSMDLGGDADKLLNDAASCGTGPAI